MAVLDNPAKSLVNGRQVVPTPGTPVQLSTSTSTAAWVVLTALSTNTNPVVVGGAGVVAAAGTRTGIALGPGASTPAINVDQLSDLYVDVVTAGEGVSYAAGI